MMKFLKELFSKEPELFVVQKNSVLLNKELFNLVVKCEKLLNDLKAHLMNENISYKDAKLAELENALLHIKSKLDALRLNVEHILNVEMKNKDFILLNDDFYLKDKLGRINTMVDIVDALIDLISERPSVSVLKDMVGFMYGRINSLIDSVNNISNDDMHLEDVYSRIRDL